ncbi:hypothetical protein JCM5350_005330, partial [Sporobolomyces pararoseus]
LWLKVTDALIASRVDMVHEGNKHRRQEDESVFRVGGKVYLSTSGLRFPESTSSKFIPRYIGPFSITSADPDKSTYVLDLPSHHNIHPRFHASKLRPHFENDDSRFPSRALSLPGPVFDVEDSAQEEWYAEKIVGDKVTRGKKLYKVRYEGYSPAEDRWRPEAELKELLYLPIPQATLGKDSYLRWFS